MAIAALLFIITSCGKEEVVVDTSDEPQLGEYVDTSIEVAKIQKDGHEYQFVAIGEDNDIIILENLYSAAAENEEGGSGIAEIDNPYDAFISLTDDNVKVPLLIAATADETVMAASNREIDESLSLLEIQDPNYNTLLEDRGCREVGYRDFINWYCGGQWSSENVSEVRYCQPYLLASWNFHNSNGGGMRNMNSWTYVSVGEVHLNVQIEREWSFLESIYRKKLTCGVWYVNVWRSERKKLRVTRVPGVNGGRFRSWTRFYN